MRPKLLVLLVIIVLAPLAAMMALGAKLVRDEQVLVRHRLQDVVHARLLGVDAEIQQRLQELARAVQAEAVTGEFSTEVLRKLSRQSPRVRQLFVMEARGELVYPALGGALTDAERAFFDRTRELWRDPSQLMSEPEASAEQQANVRTKGKPAAAMPSQGWYTWYWGSGLHFIHWWRSGDYVIGAELNRARLLADIIAILPETPAEAAAADGRLVLTDSQGAPVYQWGGYAPADGQSALVSAPLSAPLGSWSVAAYMPPGYSSISLGKGLGMAMAAGLAALALATAGMAVYFYRESARDLREAGQRVNFVNQVSHELKTPLTNIRMYAELLEQELDEASPRPKQYLRTVVAESQRLSRLIANVLTFSRKGRSRLKLQPRPAVADEVVANLVEHFAEPLRQKGMRINADYAAPEPATFDADALEQIVGNLLSNAEKYARGADSVAIRTRQAQDSIEVVVTDNGPGIAPREQDRIFEPFYRISNGLTDGIAGTGIGLTIARDLARMHGGDLVVTSDGRGATFSLTLSATKCAGDS